VLVLPALLQPLTCWSCSDWLLETMVSIFSKLHISEGVLTTPDPPWMETDIIHQISHPEKELSPTLSNLAFQEGGWPHLGGHCI
jgi:hypothetical protein